MVFYSNLKLDTLSYFFYTFADNDFRFLNRVSSKLDFDISITIFLIIFNTLLMFYYPKISPFAKFLSTLILII